MVNNMQNLIFFGPKGVGKYYALMLAAIKSNIVLQS